VASRRQAFCSQGSDLPERHVWPVSDLPTARTVGRCLELPDRLKNSRHCLENPKPYRCSRYLGPTMFDYYQFKMSTRDNSTKRRRCGVYRRCIDPS
jgi:hypothetical protein